MQKKLTFLIVLGLLTAKIGFGTGYLSMPIDYVEINQSIKSQSPFQQDKLIDIYKNLDKEILNGGNEKQIQEYLIKVNNQTIDYLAKNYPDLGILDHDNVNDVDFAVFGLVYALAEHFGYLGSNTNIVSAERESFWQCVGGVLGITAIYDLVSGASTATYSSTWSVVKKLVKRYVGWIGVGYALYEIATNCF